jgi:hypothetical protein
LVFKTNFTGIQDSEGERVTPWQKLFLNEAKTLNLRAEVGEKNWARGSWCHLKNAYPRLSSTSCSFVDRTSKVSTKHRKDTALNLKKKNQRNTTFFFYM